MGPWPIWAPGPYGPWPIWAHLANFYDQRGIIIVGGAGINEQLSVDMKVGQILVPSMVGMLS